MFKLTAGLSFPKHGKVQNDIEERVKELIEGGVYDFFCGYVPTYWSDKYGYEVSPNGRFSEPEQITDRETLELIVNEVHKYDKKIYATANFWYYTEDTFPLVERIVQEFLDVGIDGFICGNIEILEYLMSLADEIVNTTTEKYIVINNRKILLNISTILSLYNKEAIEFILDSYPINKLVLSRDITLKEIKEICESFPNTKFEVFGEFGNCRYSNGHCYVGHRYQNKHFCAIMLDKWINKKKLNYAFRKSIWDRRDIENGKEDISDSFDNDYKNQFNHIQDLLNNGFIMNPTQQEFNKIWTELELLRFRYEDLFEYNSLKEETDKTNQEFEQLYKSLLWTSKLGVFDGDSKEKLNSLLEFMRDSIQSGKEYFNLKKIETGKGKFGIIEEYKDRIYNRNDLYNLYVYKFFNSIPNIETVKIPIRGKIYGYKLKLLKHIIENDLDISDYLDRSNQKNLGQYNLDWLLKQISYESNN